MWENETNSPTHTSDGIEEMDIDPSDLLIIVPDTNIWIGNSLLIACFFLSTRESINVC